MFSLQVFVEGPCGRKGRIVANLYVAHCDHNYILHVYP